MCCAGCQAVCEAIVEGGLSDYYLHRQTLPEAPAEGLTASDFSDLALFDHPDFQQSFVRPLADGEREADLMLEGITCAACVWLNERHLAALPGVLAVQVNYTTHRARVRWREDQVHLSQILSAVVAIGYRAHPYDPARSELAAQSARRSALRRLFVAGLGMMQVMMYAYPAYVAAAGDISATAQSLMRWASLVLTTPVVGYAAAPFFVRAWAGVRRGHLGMDFPVALGIGLSFLASVWATVLGVGEVYFDSVAMFVFFLLGARYLELLARQRAARGNETLARLTPAFARRLAADGGLEVQVPVTQLAPGDVILVRPGEVIVADGVVQAGSSEVNEAWLTGESVPVAKAVGDPVLSGSINGAGVLQIAAQQVGQATRLASVRNLIERASAERPRVVALADRAASGFSWLLILLALGCGAWWWAADAAHALPVFVSVLVVSCPCALSLATPVALTVASEALARAGVLVTRSHAIESLSRAHRVVFDKTGTLTLAQLRVASVDCRPGVSEVQALACAAALEQHSEHVLARAISAAAQAAGALPGLAEAVVTEPGLGVLGTVADLRCAIGRAEFVARHVAAPMPVAWQIPQRQTVVYLASQAQWLAAIYFEDTLRPGAQALVAQLRSQGCALTILSGDTQGAVDAVAQQLAIADAQGGLLPADKLARVQAFQQQGELVVMVGDGVNDGPVLAQAQVSVAMAGGTDLARTQGDILLLNDDLERLAFARRLAQRTLGIVRQNLAWALAYNLVAIPVAMAGWVTPWLAGLGMGLSSLLVVLNALRIAKLEP